MGAPEDPARQAQRDARRPAAQIPAPDRARRLPRPAHGRHPPGVGPRRRLLHRVRPVRPQAGQRPGHDAAQVGLPGRSPARRVGRPGGAPGPAVGSEGAALDRGDGDEAQGAAARHRRLRDALSRRRRPARLFTAVPGRQRRGGGPGAGRLRRRAGQGPRSVRPDSRLRPRRRRRPGGRLLRRHLRARKLARAHLQALRPDGAQRRVPPLLPLARLLRRRHGRLAGALAAADRDLLGRALLRFPAGRCERAPGLGPSRGPALHRPFQAGGRGLPHEPLEPDAVPSPGRLLDPRAVAGDPAAAGEGARVRERPLLAAARVSQAADSEGGLLRGIRRGFSRLHAVRGGPRHLRLAKEAVADLEPALVDAGPAAQDRHHRSRGRGGCAVGPAVRQALLGVAAQPLPGARRGQAGPLLGAPGRAPPAPHRPRLPDLAPGAGSRASRSRRQGA